MILTVKTPFHVTTTREGKVFAKTGDKLTVKEKGLEYFYILKLNGKNIFSVWQRKNWILSHTY
mgnify:CR=1 FL=1